MNISFFTRPRTCSTCSWMAAIVLSAILITGSVQLRSSVPTHTASAPTTHPSVVDTSTTPAIPVMPCSVYDWFIEPDSTGKAKIRTISIQHIASLHALTCQWAVMTQELSVDSTQLPRYVEIMSDTLRLAEDAFAYAVQLRSIPPGKHYSENALYFVANVADSLYYRRLQSFNGARSSGTSMKIRGLRRLDVPNARATYVWIETEKQSVDRREEAPPTTRVKWRGHVLTHDRQRGMRYLSNAPIRAERTVDGETVGMEQWDIAVPEPGIMEVTVREYHGERVVLAPLSWIGPHVIDSSAVADTSRYRYLLEESEIWQR